MKPTSASFAAPSTGGGSDPDHAGPRRDAVDPIRAAAWGEADHEPVCQPGWAARRRARDRPARSSRPPRPRPGSRRSCPSTARGPRRGHRREAGRRARAARRTSAGRPRVVDQRGRRHQPVDSSRVEQSSSLGSAARAPSGVKPALAGSSSTFTWSRTGRSGRTRVAEAIQPLREVDRVDRLDHVEQLDRPPRPCSTAAAR